MKKIMLLALICMASLSTFSQSFRNGLGVSVFSGKPDGLDSKVMGAITWSPYLSFMEKDNLSLSVGLPLSMGLSGTYNSRADESENTLSFMFNAPLMLNFNMGAGSSRKNEDRFGWFVGGGFGYHYQTGLDEIEIDENGDYHTVGGEKSTVGPVANAGVRIGVGSSSHNIEIKASYMKGVSGSKASIIGVGCFFNF